MSKSIDSRSGMEGCEVCGRGGAGSIEAKSLQTC
jgi:hypothetical protein